jgi:hypothetical protein
MIKKAENGLDYRSYELVMWIQIKLFKNQWGNWMRLASKLTLVVDTNRWSCSWLRAKSRKLRGDLIINDAKIIHWKGNWDVNCHVRHQVSFLCRRSVFKNWHCNQMFFMELFDIMRLTRWLWKMDHQIAHCYLCKKKQQTGKRQLRIPNHHKCTHVLLRKRVKLCRLPPCLR